MFYILFYFFAAAFGHMNIECIRKSSVRNVDLCAPSRREGSFHPGFLLIFSLACDSRDNLGSVGRKKRLVFCDSLAAGCDAAEFFLALLFFFLSTPQFACLRFVPWTLFELFFSSVL